MSAALMSEREHARLYQDPVHAFDARLAAPTGNFLVIDEFHRAPSVTQIVRPAKGTGESEDIVATFRAFVARYVEEASAGARQTAIFYGGKQHSRERVGRTQHFEELLEANAWAETPILYIALTRSQMDVPERRRTAAITLPPRRSSRRHSQAFAT